VPCDVRACTNPLPVFLQLLELARLGLDIMSSTRARVFFTAGLTTLLDIVTAEQAFIVRTLTDALPVDSDLPTNPGRGGGRRNQVQREAEDVLTDDSINRLAHRLQVRAAQCIKDKNSLTALLREEGVEGII